MADNPTDKNPAQVGLPARRLALALTVTVLGDKKTLPEPGQPISANVGATWLNQRDSALARAIALTTLRHLGELNAVLRRFYKKGVPSRSGNLRYILLNAVAQILFMDVSDHAAVDLAVRLTGHDRRARHHKGLVNAGLRRIAEAGKPLLDDLDAPRLNNPKWMFEIWQRQWGEDVALKIATANLLEAPLDLTLKSDLDKIPDGLNGTLLTTGSVRLDHRGPIDTLPEFEDGNWWVQDAAAALPARLLRDVSGKHVVDFCAAPGGKTLQLIAAGARVTAIDRAETRLERLHQNLVRTKLDAEIVVADATTWTPNTAPDAILIDAPCNATGTIRRHPDVMRTRDPARADAFVDLQAKLLDHAAEIIKPGGTIVYCTCSLDPREGEDQITTFLERHSDFSLVPVTASDIGGMADAISETGYLRTLPFMTPDTIDGSPASGGIDGFFAARLVKI